MASLLVHRRDVVLGAAAAFAVAGRAEPFAWPEGDVWPAGTPAGFDAAKLAGAVEAILSQNSYSVMVLRGGRIVAERYGLGRGPHDRHEVASVAKSVVSVLVGIAIDEGKIKSVEQPAADFIAQWRGTPKAAITIRHLLSMTAGLDWTGLKLRGVEGDQFALNAAAPLIQTPGTVWDYATPTFHLLYHIVERATGVPFEDYARRVLLGPIGAGNWTWLTNTGQGENGPVKNYYSALCTARELARFGLFALNGGRWRDRQLVGTDYFRTSVAPSQMLNPAYGYLWWENAKPGHGAMEKGPLLHHFGNAPADTFGALGAGAQVVIVVPSRSLVVVRQGPIMRTQPRPDWLIEPILAAMT